MLVVDDNPSVLDLVGRLAVRAGFEVLPCAGGREALEFLESRKAHLAFVDVNMPDISGLEVLKTIRDVDPRCHVVVMSGNVSIDTAVEAIKRGAIDFLSKPFDFARLREILETERQEIARRLRLLAQEARLLEDREFCGMIGRSAAMLGVFALIRRVAPHSRAALVTGETGTGKELVARALHALGPRRAGPFVAINCSAVVETLFESELFGHRRGAFTGAVDNKVGVFGRADRGVLFLDEIGDLPLSLQAKLLRVLETGEVQRVGEITGRTVDVCVVASTNRLLRDDISAGRFRDDLYYRLNVIEIHLPPLCDRREDIPLLVAAFIRDCAARVHKPIVGTTAGAERLLLSAAWAGNVRELRNVIERACILAESEFITERELTPVMGQLTQPAAPQRGTTAAATATQDADDSLSALERERIVEVMARTKGNKVMAARILGLSRRALYRRLERYGIEPGPRTRWE